MKTPDIDNEFFTIIHDRNRSMMSFDKILNLYYWVLQILEQRIPGELLEVGCYKGYSAILVQKILSSFNDLRKVIIFDSFQGLPKKSVKDLLDENSFDVNQKTFLDNRRINQGWFKSSKQIVIDNFIKYNLPQPKIIEGWFEKTLKTNILANVAFAHLDGDFYSSTKVALENIFPKLSVGGVLLIDDYCDNNKSTNALPGVKRACDEYFEDKLSKVQVLPTMANNHQAILIKQDEILA